MAKARLNLDKARIDADSVGRGPDYFAYQFVNVWANKLIDELEEMYLQIDTLKRENGELEMNLSMKGDSD